MTANVITATTSRSLPSCDLYQCRCLIHQSTKSAVSTIKKQRSLDNANLAALSIVEQPEPNSTMKNPIVTNNVDNSKMIILTPAVPIPVSINEVKPIFDLSPTNWEPLWDEDNFLTDSTTDSPPHSPTNYENSISSHILDDDLLEDLETRDIPSSTPPQSPTLHPAITLPRGSVSTQFNDNESNQNTVNENYENLNNNNNISNKNAVNISHNNKNNNGNNQDKIVSKLTYKSSSDSLSSYTESLSSSYTETAYNNNQSSNLPESFSSSSLTSSGGDSPRRRIRDSEGYIRRAACVCVDETENQVMLTSSKKCEDVWLVPGGGLEAGEDAEEAALREAWEEAGVKGRIARFLGVFQTQHEGNSKKHRTAVFVIVVTSLHDVFPESHIGRHRRWFSLEDAQVQLDLHKPLQSEYLHFLVMNKLNNNVNSTPSSTLSSSSSSTLSSSTSSSTLSSTPLTLQENL